jgi:hypothetical protein
MKFNFSTAVNLTRCPPQMLRAMEILRGLKNGDLITTVVLSERLNTTPNCLSRFTPNLPATLSVVYKGKRIYGNEKTIAAFKKQYAIQT